MKISQRSGTLPQVGDIRQVGLVAGIELVKDWRTRAPFPLRAPGRHSRVRSDGAARRPDAADRKRDRDHASLLHHACAGRTDYFSALRKCFRSARGTDVQPESPSLGKRESVGDGLCHQPVAAGRASVRGARFKAYWGAAWAYLTLAASAAIWTCFCSFWLSANCFLATLRRYPSTAGQARIPANTTTRTRFFFILQSGVAALSNLSAGIAGGFRDTFGAKNMAEGVGFEPTCTRTSELLSR